MVPILEHSLAVSFDSPQVGGPAVRDSTIVATAGVVHPRLLDSIVGEDRCLYLWNLLL